MIPIEHSPSETPRSHLGSTPEDTFVPPGWYFEQASWVEDPLTPSNAAHNYPLPLRIRGPLNRKALEQSLQEILRRHQVLRSVFQVVDGKLLQMIILPTRLTMGIWDLTGLSEESMEEEARLILLEDARRPFDLTRGPILRAGLLRLGTEDHILLLTTHHLVCDDWSTRILLRELFTLYAAFSAGQPSPLSELTYQYSDYVRWLEKRLRGKEGESRLVFWKERLAGGNDFHHIVPDHPRPECRGYRGTRERTSFSEQLSDSVILLGQKERVSPFMVMLAGLQCLLQSYSGEEDIGVAACVANRPLLQVEGLIGPFANVSVLRTDLSGNPTFREVLRRVREVSLSAYSNQDLPFGTLVNNLYLRPDPNRNPLFQALFVLLDAPNELWHIPDLTVDPYSLDTGSTRYELNLWVKSHEELNLQYNSKLFEAATIRQILEDYRAVLETMTKHPGAQVSELGIAKRPGVHLRSGEFVSRAQR
jgi:hypothetical protein